MGRGIRNPMNTFSKLPVHLNAPPRKSPPPRLISLPNSPSIANKLKYRTKEAYCSRSWPKTCPILITTFRQASSIPDSYCAIRILKSLKLISLSLLEITCRTSGISFPSKPRFAVRQLAKIGKLQAFKDLLIAEIYLPSTKPILTSKEEIHPTHQSCPHFYSRTRKLPTKN
jgi:hypothetical protein